MMDMDVKSIELTQFISYFKNYFFHLLISATRPLIELSIEFLKEYNVSLWIHLKYKMQVITTLLYFPFPLHPKQFTRRWHDKYKSVKKNSRFFKIFIKKMPTFYFIMSYLRKKFIVQKVTKLDTVFGPGNFKRLRLLFKSYHDNL